MKSHPNLAHSSLAAVVLSSLLTAQVSANSVYEAISQGTVNANLLLRYESVSQDNALKDANALTFRTQLAYTSADYKGWSFKIEMEDNRIVLGQGDYTVGPTGYNVGEY